MLKSRNDRIGWIKTIKKNDLSSMTNNVMKLSVEVQQLKDYYCFAYVTLVLWYFLQYTGLLTLWDHIVSFSHGSNLCLQFWVLERKDSCCESCSCLAITLGSWDLTLSNSVAILWYVFYNSVISSEINHWSIV